MYVAVAGQGLWQLQQIFWMGINGLCFFVRFWFGWDLDIILIWYSGGPCSLSFGTFSRGSIMPPLVLVYWSVLVLHGFLIWFLWLTLSEVQWQFLSFDTFSRGSMMPPGFCLLECSCSSWVLVWFRGWLCQRFNGSLLFLEGSYCFVFPLVEAWWMFFGGYMAY